MRRPGGVSSLFGLLEVTGHGREGRERREEEEESESLVIIWTRRNGKYEIDIEGWEYLQEYQDTRK